jgi:hypothetical protein
MLVLKWRTITQLTNIRARLKALLLLGEEFLLCGGTTQAGFDDIISGRQRA